MNITVNGETREFIEGITLTEMMRELDIIDKVMAAAVNMTIVKQESWDSHTLYESDSVELLDFVGGG